MMKKICDARQPAACRRRAYPPCTTVPSSAAHRRSPAVRARCSRREQSSRTGGTATRPAARRDAAERATGTIRTRVEIEGVARGRRGVEMAAVNRDRAFLQEDRCGAAPDRGRHSERLWVRGDLLPHGFEQRRQPVAGGRRNSVERNPPALQMLRSRASRSGSSSASILLAATMTGLSCSRSPDASRPGNSASSRVMTSKSSTGSRPDDRRDVDEVHQHLRPLEVTQEPMAQTVSEVRAFDQPWDVRDDERAIAREARPHRGWARAS